jgi:hypothetical protein
MTKVGSGAEEEREHRTDRRRGFYGGLATLYSWQTLSEKLAGMTGNMGWAHGNW